MGGKRHGRSAKTPFSGHEILDPPFARFLFTDKRSSWLWLILRVWLGAQWIDAVSHTISDPAWVGMGAASGNGPLLVLAVLPILARDVAGYFGADRHQLRWIGVPWANAAPASRAKMGQ